MREELTGRLRDEATRLDTRAYWLRKAALDLLAEVEGPAPVRYVRDWRVIAAALVLGILLGLAYHYTLGRPDFVCAWYGRPRVGWVCRPR